MLSLLVVLIYFHLCRHQRRIERQNAFSLTRFLVYEPESQDQTETQLADNREQHNEVPCAQLIKPLNNQLNKPFEGYINPNLSDDQIGPVKEIVFNQDNNPESSVSNNQFDQYFWDSMNVDTNKKQ